MKFISPCLVSFYLGGLVKVLFNMSGIVLYQCFANLRMQSFLKHIAAPTPRVSDSVGLGWGLRIFISNKFPGKVSSVADLGTTLRDHCPTSL